MDYFYLFIGLKEGDTITCTVVTDAHSLTSCNVSPVTKKDLEVFMMSPTRIQSELLEQIRIVNRGQILIVWISRSIYLQLQVDSMSPSHSYGRLENKSELIVSTSVGQGPIVPASNGSVMTNGSSNKKRLSRSDSGAGETLYERIERRLNPEKAEADLEARIANVIKRDPSKSNLPQRNSFVALSEHESPPDTPSYNGYNDRVQDMDMLMNGLRRSMTMADMKLKELENGGRQGSSSSQSRESLNQVQSPAESWSDMKRTVSKEQSHEYEFRIIPGKWEDDTQLCDVYATRKNLPPNFDTTQIYLLKTSGDKEYHVNVKVVSDTNFPDNIYSTIEMSENLMKVLELKPFERVFLKQKPVMLNLVDKIELIPAKKLDEGSRDPRKYETTFKNYIIDNTKLYPLLLNQDQVMKVRDFYVTIRLWPISLKCASIDSKILRENKIEVSTDHKNVTAVLNPESDPKEVEEPPDTKPKGHHIEIGKFNEIVKSCVERLKDSLCLAGETHASVADNLLFVGEFIFATYWHSN